MIFVNFKTYQSGTGEEAVKMAKVVERVSRESGIEMAVVVQAVDVRMVASEVLVPVWCQHADEVDFGAHTGWVLPEGIKAAGAVGVLLNHSEHKIGDRVEAFGSEGAQARRGRGERVKRILERCKEAGLKTLVCAADEEEARIVLECGPDMMAYEPPELIGSRDKTVATAKPEIIQKIIELVGQTPVLIGAGIHMVEDIRVGLELGAHGFLIASDIMLAESPVERLRELVKGYRES